MGAEQAAADPNAIALAVFIAGCVGLIGGGLFGYVVGYGRGYQDAAMRALQEQDRLAERVNAQRP